MSSNTPQTAAHDKLETLRSRYVGTGNSEISQHAWASEQHRDSIASYLGHPSMLQYFGVAEGISIERVKFNLLERMHRPCGEPPKKKDIGSMGTD